MNLYITSIDCRTKLTTKCCSRLPGKPAFQVCENPITNSPTTQESNRLHFLTLTYQTNILSALNHPGPGIRQLRPAGSLEPTDAATSPTLSGFPALPGFRKHSDGSEPRGEGRGRVEVRIVSRYRYRYKEAVTQNQVCRVV